MKMMPPPSTPATMPTARMMTRIGMPRRDDSELTRILAPTSNAPIRNRLLMVLASKGRYSETAGKGRGSAFSSKS
ncbi:hypothetical protein D3C71_2080390 [compost metagenome]